MTAAILRAPSSAPDTCRLRRLRRAQEGGDEGGQTARHRYRLLSRDRRRFSGRRCAHLVSRRRQGGGQHRRRRQRPGAETVSPTSRRGGWVLRRRRSRSFRRFARDVPGFGAVASRSATTIGGAVARTADLALEKGKRVAAMLLQAAEGEVDYRDGKFSVKGSGREVSFFAVAERRRAQSPGVIRRASTPRPMSRFRRHFPMAATSPRSRSIRRPARRRSSLTWRSAIAATCWMT